MKKALSIILAVMMLMSICVMGTACGSKEATTKSYSCGVQTGTTGWSYMEGDADWGFAGYKNIKTLTFDNGGLAVADMLNGNVDFVVIDDAPAKNLVAANKGTKVIDIPLTVESYGIGVDKNNAELLTKINTVLSEKKADIDAIFEKYADVNDDNSANWTGTTVESAKLDSSKEQFVIATNAAFAPFEFKVGDKFAGIDMEIAKLIADELGMELVIEDMEFDAVVTSVGSNGIDAAVSGLTINAKRAKSVNFSDAYYSGAYQVIICKDDCTLFDACKTGDDLAAVLNGLGK